MAPLPKETIIIDSGTTLNRLDTPQAATQSAASARIVSSKLKNSVDAINRFLENNSEVHFNIDEESCVSVVKVIDTETKKVWRQFPSEQSLGIGKNLTSLKGLLI